MLQNIVLSITILLGILPLFTCIYCRDDPNASRTHVGFHVHMHMIVFIDTISTDRFYSKANNETIILIVMRGNII